MARKTFISYKYSEARNLRDRIITKLGDDAKFYQGENGFSNDLSSNTAQTIKRYLADMIFGTSVTIVILSPQMSLSRWIPWEIEYSLSEYSRSDRTSHTNGVVCVVQKQSNPFANSAFMVSQGSYNWLEKTSYNSAWQAQTGWDENKLFSIIKSNRDNKKTWQQSPIPANNRVLYDSLSQNYIDIVTEDAFLRNPDKYIEEAYLKSQNADSYNITKQVNEWGGILLLMSIPRHKVFISYYHADDQWYKNQLIQMKEFDSAKYQWVSVFDDYSVHENEIDDTGMTDEQIRREIRDNYIKNATVMVLLCGENTRKRKHIDWEIHAAMYDSDINPQMGILVINVGSNQGQIACGKDEESIIGPYDTWTPLKKDEESLKQQYPYLPDRIIENIARDDVRITVANWSAISNNTEKIKDLIDKAFNRRKANKYDHSTPLRRRNS